MKGDPILQDIHVYLQHKQAQSTEKSKGIRTHEKKSTDFFSPSNEKQKPTIKVNFEVKNKNDATLTKTPSVKTFQEKYTKKDLLSHYNKNSMPKHKEINLYVKI